VNRDKPQGQAEFHYNLTVRTQVVLNFTTVGKPPPELSLFKKSSNGDYEQHNSARFTINFSGITINLVEPEDQGEYRLNALSEGEIDDEEFTISVFSKYFVSQCSIGTEKYGLCAVNN